MFTLNLIDNVSGRFSGEFSSHRFRRPALWNRRRRRRASPLGENSSRIRRDSQESDRVGLRQQVSRLIKRKV